jgi:hypothetical protein
LSDVEILVRAALDGVGLAFVSDEYVAPHLASGALVRVLEDWCQPFPGFFLYYPSRRQQPAALSALINAIAGRIQREHHSTTAGEVALHRPVKGGTGVSRPISESEGASDTPPVDGRLCSTSSAVKAA